VSRRIVTLTAASLLISAFALDPSANATFPGGNGRIAFARTAPGHANQNIFTVAASGGAIKRVTRGNTIDFTPSWSPTGARIAFGRLNSTGGLDVFTVRPGGRGLKQITHGPPGTANGEPAWSPDGHAIAFTRGPFSGSSPSEIFRMRANGTGLKQLTSSTVDSRAADWTNGLIAYVQGEPPNSSIWTMRPDGSRQRRLTAPASATDHPSWSPDGKSIAFDKQLAGGSSAIYVMDRSGRHVRRVSGTRGIHEQPAFSPNGALIAFAGGPKSQLSLYTITTRGKQLKRLTSTQGSNFQPDWQPLALTAR
jgi:TolB protein